MRRRSFILAILAGAAINAKGQDWLDTFDDKLAFNTRDGFLNSRVSGLLDLEGYYIDQRPPGLLFEDESFFNPRLSLFLDAKIGPHFYVFAQGRIDRGFDPGSENFDARADEYLLRWIPWNDDRLNLQFGKFATVVGSWVQRHDSWSNPLITAPLPYENVTPVSDDDIPTSRADFLSRRHGAVEKDSWLPILWGPAYTTGWSVFGTWEKFDYSFDVKNAAISSHPYTWELGDSLWSYPTFSGRVGVRPSPAWNYGVSFSVGPYLNSEAADELPTGKSISDYNQYTIGQDLSYAWHHWQFWSEVFLTRFEVPNVGNADLLAYYIEAKYKITAQLYAAARWNQELFGSISDGAGGEQRWGNDISRVDLALGYRFNRHFQGKIQYSFSHQDSSLQQGEQLAAAQLTLKF